MRKMITKQQVIEAIRTEPLRGGNFNHWMHDFRRDPHTCSVCAVGAVIRANFDLTSDQLRDFDLYDVALKRGDALADDDEHLKKTLKEKNYLSALSMAFERLISNKQYLDGSFTSRREVVVTPQMKGALVKFINKNFPDKFYINLKE